MKKSRIVLVLCMMVVIAVASVAGTIAWLTDTTDPVTNTFTPTGIGIKLEETWNTDDDEDGEKESWKAQMIPGKEYAKDPKVTVVLNETNVEIYLYVKVEENDCQTYLNYELNIGDGINGWTAVKDVENVYYRAVRPEEEDQSWYLLKDNKVTVDPNLQKADEDASTLSMPGAQTMKFTAYAIQKEGFTPETGWAEVSKLAN